MRLLTVQTGKHANWVGSHYWSALEHKPEWTSRETREQYNESVHGSIVPRLFVIDSADSIGPFSVELPPEQPLGESAFELRRVEPEPVHVHPLRQSVLLGQSTDVAFDSNSFRSWTDFWEPVSLPEHKLVVSLSEAPSETSHRFWFEYADLSPESLDESDLRRLIEETDNSVDIVRAVSSIGNGLVSHGLSVTDYLGSAYPKASFLTLTSPLPSMDHFQHDHAIPSVLNLANLIFTESIRDKTLIVVPPHRDLDLITASAEEAVWLDSISFKPVASTVLEAPYLTIDGRTVFPVTDGSYGSHLPQARAQPVYKNRGSPLQLLANSDVITGTMAPKSLLPVLQATVPLLRRFERDFKAAWEPHDLEKDDLVAIGEHLEGLINDLKPECEE